MVKKCDEALLVDARGSLCPEPLVRTLRALNAAAPGQLLEVLTTDPMAELDLEALCARTGHQYLGAMTEAGGQRIRIRKADVSPARPPAGGR